MKKNRIILAAVLTLSLMLSAIPAFAETTPAEKLTPSTPSNTTTQDAIKVTPEAIKTTPEAVTAKTEITVTVDGVAVKWTDATPYIDANSRTMVPLRAIGEAIGLDVSWDQKTQVALFSKTFDEAFSVAAKAVLDTNADKKDDAYLAGTAIGFPIDSKAADTSMYYYSIGGDKETVVKTVEDVVQMDTAAVMKDNRTYAPVKYLAQYFGYDVAWDQKTKTVIITGADKVQDEKTTTPAIEVTPAAITTYKDFKNVPDFGALLNVKPIKTETVKDVVIYSYDATKITDKQLDSYQAKLEACGFELVKDGKVPSYITDGIVVTNKTDKTTLYVGASADQKAKTVTFYVAVEQGK